MLDRQRWQDIGDDTFVGRQVANSRIH
jgi:hypothetical protein